MGTLEASTLSLLHSSTRRDDGRSSVAEGGLVAFAVDSTLHEGEEGLPALSVDVGRVSGCLCEDALRDKGCKGSRPEVAQDIDVVQTVMTFQQVGFPHVHLDRHLQTDLIFFLDPSLDPNICTEWTSDVLA